MAVALAEQSMNPATVRSLARRAGSSAVSAAFARSSALRLAVESNQAAMLAYSCAPSSGMSSGSSGERRAKASDCATARARPSGDTSLVETLARFLPTTELMVIDASSEMPEVDI